MKEKCQVCGEYEVVEIEQGWFACEHCGELYLP